MIFVAAAVNDVALRSFFNATHRFIKQNGCLLNSTSVGFKQTNNAESQQAYAHLYAAHCWGVFLFWVSLTLVQQKEGEEGNANSNTLAVLVKFSTVVFFLSVEGSPLTL